MRAVSRLGWHTDVLPSDQEIPHVRGLPVGVVLADGVVRVRSWPNRLGILETGSPTDRIEWQTDLAAAPEDGTVSAVGQSGNPRPESLRERTKVFRKFVKGLAQMPGVELVVVPDAMCTIILTPGLRVDEEQEFRYPSGVQPVPKRLGEFPGGLQLRVGDSEWQRFDRYAATVQHLLAGEERP